MSWRVKYGLAWACLLACLVVPVAIGLLCHDFLYSVAWLPVNLCCGYTSGRVMAVALNQRDREARETA